MKHGSPFRRLALGAALLPASLGAQTPLPLGSTSQGMLSGGEAGYVFAAKDAGFLTIILRSEAGEDLSLLVTDEEGQALLDGMSDADVGGDVGAEQLVVTIPGAGRYQVRVRSFMEETASFQIGASFLTSKLAAAAEDPDGRPSRGIELAVGAVHEDAIDPAAGDRVDWYRIKVEKDGVLTVLTRSDDEGDLRLEHYVEPTFDEPMDSSDQDMEGVMGNESLTLEVSAGDVVLIRVAPSFSGGGAVTYRISSGLIAG